VPCQTKPGRKDLVPVICDALLAPRPLRIAREDQARRRVRVNSAVYVLIEQVHVEMVKPSVLVLECVERFPPQAVIDGETRSGLPRILHVRAEILLPVVQIRLNIPLRPADRLTEQKISQAKAA